MEHFELRAIHRSDSGATEVRAFEDARGRLLMSARQPVRSGDVIGVRGVERIVLKVEQSADLIQVTLGDSVERSTHQ